MKCFCKSDILKITFENLQFVRKSNALCYKVLLIFNVDLEIIKHKVNFYRTAFVWRNERVQRGTSVQWIQMFICIRYDSYWLDWLFAEISQQHDGYIVDISVWHPQCSSVVSYQWAVHVFNPAWNVVASRRSLLRSLRKICNLFRKVIASYRIREIAL